MNTTVAPIKGNKAPSFALSTNPELQGGKVIKPIPKPVALPTSELTSDQVANTVSLAISSAKRSATAVQRA